MSEENRHMKTHLVMNDEKKMSVPYYIPQQIKRAYGFTDDFQGEGTTIAIVIAFGNPNIEEDLRVFNERFGLPDADLQIVYPDGPPDSNDDPGWVIETSLDVQWSHALAPRAKQILVVAKNAFSDSIFNAISYAATAGADVVSMSFGSEEFDFLRKYDPIFDQPGVAFVASTGDNSNVSYPSTNSRVIAAGGTTLQLDPCGERLAAEIAWCNTGGGISTIEEKPPWQYIPSSAVPKTSMRTIPDIAFLADPFPGVAVYYTIEEQGQTVSVWRGVGGTSVSAPCLAALVADATESNKRVDNPAKRIYEIYRGCRSEISMVYTDISNGNNLFYQAIPGYDYTTGLGVPNVPEFIRRYREY